MNAHMSWPGQILELFSVAEQAIRQIPPAFPLEATVAVNPWLGQVKEDRLIAAARLARVGGGRIFLPRQTAAAMIAAGDVLPEDLAAAAAAHGMTPDALIRATQENGPDPDPLPTVADLVQKASGINWPDLIEERIGLWAAAYFDRGQAFWPAPGGSAWTAWRAFASRDLTPDIAGLSGFSARVVSTPTDAHGTFADACRVLGITPAVAGLYFHRLLTTLSGWGQYARHLGWVAERDGTHDGTLFDLLTVRLVWEVALLDAGGNAGVHAWERARSDYALPVKPSIETTIDAALQAAVDRSGERRLALDLAGNSAKASLDRPAIQAAFCIDVRSERLRRALEASDQTLRTIGFAGFFGLPVLHHGHASDIAEARSPILLSPQVLTTTPGDEMSDRIRLRAVRAWGRFKRAAVSAFAFVEAAGPLYVAKLLHDGLGHTTKAAAESAPRLDLPLGARIDAAAGILHAMSLTSGFARLVLICGHGATVTNAPHASALQCGACGGHAGDVNARLVAALLNDRDVRIGLVDRGIDIPDDTHFIAGLHDTVSDNVQLFEDWLSAVPARDLDRLVAALRRASGLVRTERAVTMPRGRAEKLAKRGQDWSELRPEWGLAGCRAFIAAPRSRTAGRDLGGQVFLHDYDWSQDREAATLDLILRAPVVVASWIALQYHGSAVAPDTFGAGNKLLHNVVGGIGILEGNGGALRVGLPMQSLQDGAALRHVPKRLVVAVEAPEAMILDVLRRQPDVRALFDNGWLSLASIDGMTGLIRWYEEGKFTGREGTVTPIPAAA